MNKELEESRIKISIIIVDYGGQHYWDALLESISSMLGAYCEVIVVDNGGSFVVSMSSCDRWIRVIKPGDNIGFSAGCNLGVKHANGDWVVFLNNDLILSSTWKEALLRRASIDFRTGAIVSKVIFYPRYILMSIISPVFSPCVSSKSKDKRELGIRVLFDNSWNESTGCLEESGFHGIERLDGEEWRWTDGGGCVWIPVAEVSEDRFKLIIETPIELKGEKVKIVVGGEERTLVIDGRRKSLFYNLGECETFDVINSAGSELSDDGACLERGIYEVDRGQYDESCEVSAFSGCSVMIRKETFEKLGGFDPAFFAYYEDTDLSWRMRKAGWKIVYEPKSVVRHHRSGTSGEQSAFFCFHIYRNFRWNVAKNARIPYALGCLLKELFSWIPSQVNTDGEFSAFRLKRETIGGMVRYLWRRAVRK